MNVEELVSALTLEEKAGLCSGADFWHIEGFLEYLKQENKI